MTDAQSFTMPSDPATRKKIKDTLHEMAGILQSVKDKNDSKKDLAASLEADYQIPKNISAKMARVLFKNNYSDVEAEADQFTTAFETLFKPNSGTPDSD